MVLRFDYLAPMAKKQLYSTLSDDQKEQQKHEALLQIAQSQKTIAGWTRFFGYVTIVAGVVTLIVSLEN